MKAYIAGGLLLLVLISGCIRISSGPTGAVVVEDAPEEPAEQAAKPILETIIETEVVGEGTTEEKNATKEPKEEGPKTNTIEIKDLKLDPQELKIKVGDTVIWNHSDRFADRSDIKHMIKAHYNEFRSTTLYYGDTFNHTFSKAGEYGYIDVVYKETKDLRGNIIVE